MISTGCSVPPLIDTNNNYTCSFVGRIASSNCELTHINKVTADVTDDDGANAKPTDDATVTLPRHRNSESIRERAGRRQS